MSDDPRLQRGFELRVRLARVVVAVERIWPAIWPAVGVAGLFLAVSLLDLWHRLSPLLHVAGLLAFAVGFALTLWRARGAFGGVGPEAALARLERDSAIPHRALRALDDRLPEEVADPATRALWEAHRARLARLVGRLRLAPPRSALPARDPWALRAALLLLLVVALVDGRGEYGARLRAAFSPAVAETVPPPAVTASLWVTPPAYTRKAPLGAEQTRNTERLVVPAGSEALGQLHHLPEGLDPTAARLAVPGSEPLAFAALGPGSGEAKATLGESGRLAILGPDGKELAGWILEVVPDLAPTVSFLDEPKQTHRGVLRIAFEAVDDYGVAEIALELATAALFAGAAAAFDRPYVAAVMAAFLAVLLALALIDARHRILPNRIVYPAIVGFALLVAAGALAGEGFDLAGAAVGFLGYGGGLLLVAIVSPRGMGMGDVKLAALIGLVVGSLGAGRVLVAAGVGILLGGLVAVGALLAGRGRRQAIPFGPFLAAGAAAAVLAGERLARLYLDLVLR